MSKIRQLLIPLSIVCLMPNLVLAETTQQQNQSGYTATHAAIPSRGMSMNQVEQRFGQAMRRHSPVGDPPITRWDYDGITVYFEYKHVIHAVISQK